MDLPVIATTAAWVSAIASAGKFAYDWSTSRRERSERTKVGMPNLIGSTWSCKWYLDGDLYSSDTFVIKRWKKGARFEGEGTDNKGAYQFEGEYFAGGYVVAGYRDKAFPTHGRLGTFMLEYKADGRTMSGRWYGLITELDEKERKQLVGGAVTCVRTDSPQGHR